MAKDPAAIASVAQEPPPVRPARGRLLALRRLVLRTTGWPTRWLYQAAYEAVIRLVGWHLQRQPGVITTWLRRGGGRGWLVPGISDLDFAVLVDDGIAPTDEVQRRYHRLARHLPLLDACLEVYTPASLRRAFREDDLLRLRLWEGRQGWRRLHGPDALDDLPHVTPDDLHGGWLCEVRIWWSFLSSRLILGRPDDDIAESALCYKATAEVLRARHALAGRTGSESRETALQAAIEEAAGNASREEATCLDGLRRLAEGRFLAAPPDLAARTTRWMVEHLADLHRRPERLPATRPLEGWTLRLRDGPEPPPPAADEVVLHARTHWEGYLGAWRARSVLFNLDEEVLLLAVRPGSPPPLSALRQVASLHGRRPHGLSRRTYLYLLYDTVALQLDADEPHYAWKAILTPTSAPDLFLALSQGQGWVDGASTPDLPRPAITPTHLRLLDHEVAEFLRFVHTPAVYRLDPLAFLRVFFKTCQLITLHRQLPTRAVAYPLTPAAVAQALGATGAPIPPGLADLLPAWDRVISGLPVDLDPLIVPAVTFLRGLSAGR